MVDFICPICGGISGDENHRARQLAALAPRMLEALELALPRLETTAASLRVSGSTSTVLQEAIDACSAIIREARGES